jgi:hypothetical protein
MTNEQFQKGLESLKAEIAILADNAPFAESQTILGLSTTRIFNKGKASDGSQIGTYDDKRKQTFLTKKAKSSFNKKQLKDLEEGYKLHTLIYNLPELYLKIYRQVKQQTGL